MNRGIVLSVIFLIGISLATEVVLAQASNKNLRKLQITKKGEVLDSQGAKLGYISKEDVVYNHQGIKLGFMENGKVYDAEGNPLGKAKKNGRYYNNQGINVLTVKSQGDICEILDPEGHNMGTVHKNYKLHSCAVHCFFLEKKKDIE